MADPVDPTPTDSSLVSRWWNASRCACTGWSLPRVQALVATTAGILSIGGAVFSATPFAGRVANGQLVATVQEAGSHRTVADATIEVLTTDNALVATLTPDAAGRASQDLHEGVYVVRVSHPRYAADVRRVQVQSRHTVEIKASLRSGSSSPVQRAVSDGVRAVRRALPF
ncbi:MAG TPA: carboxypeptidase regulatory-like domain-containing protein [Rhodanobacteraceae bacterium]